MRVACTTECNLVVSDLVVTHTEHACIDFMPARATLFLHEDLVARTLQFERELKDWRLAEIQAGRGDPGRPGYGHVFMTVRIFLLIFQYSNVNTTSPKARHHRHLTAGIQAYIIEASLAILLMTLI